MSSSLFFQTREEAVAFLENCRKGGNYMAESYADRVNASHAILYFDNWHPDPLPPLSRADAPLPKKALNRSKRQRS